MAATKKIHLSPNGNLIKMNGKIYRHYTRNIEASLPSIFYAISHGAIVTEILPNGDLIELTTQNYALDNEKIMRERREQKEAEKREKMQKMAQNEGNLSTYTGNASESDFTQNPLPEPIEMNELGNGISSSTEEDDKNIVKKSTKKTNGKKSSVEE